MGLRVEGRLAAVTQSPRRLVGGLEAPRYAWTHTAPDLLEARSPACLSDLRPSGDSLAPDPTGCGCGREWELHGLAVGMGGMGVEKL